MSQFQDEAIENFDNITPAEVLDDEDDDDLKFSDVKETEDYINDTQNVKEKIDNDSDNDEDDYPQEEEEEEEVDNDKEDYLAEKVDKLDIDNNSNSKTEYEIDTDKDINLANEAKEEGNNYFRVKDYDNAISSYSRAANLCPTDDTNKEFLSVFLGNRAACYFAIEEYDCVVDDCTSALEIKSDYVKVLMRRSQAYEKLRKPEDALVGE